MRRSFRLAQIGAAASVAAFVLCRVPRLGAADATPSHHDSPQPQPVGTDDHINMQMRSPQEEMAAISLPPGYHLELVACEPDIISPVLCAWDGNGRMFVAEMRTYMLDADGSREKEPVSRVDCFEDTKDTGVYDKRTIFADHLVLPRMILPLDDRILIRETDTRDLVAYRDTKHDGAADEKTRVYEGGPQSGNLEHQPSGLMWNIDNWIYTTADNMRFRFTHGKIETDKMPARAGQWGLAIDDAGRMIFHTAGGENPALDFQVPLEYGSSALKGELADGFVEVYPALHLTDVQGGPSRLWPGGGLNHITGCAGGCVYRGDALPADLQGDYILPEPVGRLIRRGKFSNDHGKTVLTNALDHKEWITSTDPNFRPVWAATGPDGCLYICDMYHGIIQESAWTKEGSYLRPQIQRYGLDKNINAGRIYRLVHDGMKRRSNPHMLSESPSQLVKHLSDPNGWWRDTAQKLIILRGDKSVIPELQSLARTTENPLTRLHALWTLDGLDAADASFIAEKLKDQDPRVRAAAIRMSEPLIKSNDPVVMAAFRKELPADPDPNVAVQFCLSLLHEKHPEAEKLVKAALDAHVKDEPVKELVQGYRDEVSGAKAERERMLALAKKDPKLAAVFAKGKDYYMQTCIACHGIDGKGAPVPGGAPGLTLAPPLAGSKRIVADRELVCRIVLRGLEGPNDGGKIYPNTMAGFIFLDDAWLSAAVTYARNEWGNKAPALTPDDFAAVRKQTVKHDKPYTLKELAELKPEAKKN